MFLRRAFSSVIPGLERDLTKAMAPSKRLKFNAKQSAKVYSFEPAPITDGPLGKTLQSASPVRSIKEPTTPKGLF